MLRADHRPVFAGTICVLLIAIVWIVFGQTFGHDFINYDDDQYVYDNPRISNGISLDGIGWAFTHVHAQNWHPLTTISHMLDCQLYGLQPWGHHLTNILLQCVVAILLFLTLRQLTQAVWPSAFVAAVFAIHPLRVESVAWVAERKDVLSGVFFMLTLWAYARYARADRNSSARYAMALICFSLGLMCKPTLVTLPFLLLLLDYWPLQRVKARSQSVRDLLVEKIPFFLLSAGSCVATLFAQKGVVIPMAQLTFAGRVSNAMVSYLIYLSQMFWPFGLSVLCPYPAGGVVPMASAFLAYLVLLIISIAFFIWRRRYPFLLVGWLWFLGVLVPMIGLVQVGGQARADRYTYLSHIGLYILVTWGALKLFNRWRGGRVAKIGLAVFIVTGLAAASYVEASSWRNSETLWKKALAHTEHNHIAHSNLGDALLKKGQLDEAVTEFRKALEIDPDYPEANNNLGYALTKKGKWADAIPFYRAALRVRPNYSQAHNNLGISLAQMGRSDEALAEFREALRIDPDYAKAHSNLAIVLLQLGQRDEAVAQLRETLRLKPDDEEVKAHLRQLGMLK